MVRLPPSHPSNITFVDKDNQTLTITWAQLESYLSFLRPSIRLWMLGQPPFPLIPLCTFPTSPDFALSLAAIAFMSQPQFLLSHETMSSELLAGLIALYHTADRIVGLSMSQQQQRSWPGVDLLAQCIAWSFDNGYKPKTTARKLVCVTV